jgi:Putative peptidoglycan binding domain
MSSFGARPSFRPSVSSRPTIRSVAPSVRGSNRLTNRAMTPSVRSTNTFNRQETRSSGNRITQASRPTNRSITSSIGATTARQIGLNGRTDHIFRRHEANWHNDWDRRRAHYANNHWWAYNGDNWIGLDAGFYPWDYYPYYTYDYYPYDYLIDDSTDVPPAYQGTTTTAPAPDPTVTAVQTQLSQQGYYGGPIDGLFGPTTRDAVARYQAKQNLTVTGSLTPDTLQALGLSQVATS